MLLNTFSFTTKFLKKLNIDKFVVSALQSGNNFYKAIKFIDKNKYLVVRKNFLTIIFLF
jgi:hypothetical protein